MFPTICSLLFMIALLCMNSTDQGQLKYIVLKFPQYHKTIYIRGEDDLATVEKSDPAAGSIEMKHIPPRTLIVSGRGDIRYRDHRVHMDHSGVSFDGKMLPRKGINFILTEKGDLKEGFIRTFDRQPLHLITK